MTEKLLRADTCPNKANHTPSPESIPAWHKWAQHMAKTHHQIRCPECGLWAIWVPNSEVSDDDTARDVTG